MAGYQTAAAGHLILQRGRPPTPVVDVALIRSAPTAVSGPVKRAAPTDGRRSYTVVTNKMISEMCARRATGETIRSIALDLGLSDSTVGLHVAEVAPPPGGWKKGGIKPKGSLEQIERMKRAGFTYKEIAENFGVSESAITKRLKPYPSMFLSRPKPIHIQTLSIVQRVTGIKGSQMRRVVTVVGGRGSDDIGHARWIAAWLLVRRRNYSFHEAGKLLGGYDYSSINFMVDRVDAKLKKLELSHDKPMRALVRALWVGEWPRRRSL